MTQYEWDENKNQSNQKKHSISFEKATEAFQDDHAIEFEGNSPTELRILRIGKTLSKILIAVVYTLRTVSIRIISARQANKEETKAYIENSLSKQSIDENNS